MDSKVTEQYDSHKIKILEGLLAVRKRPGMYIGTQDETGLHKMVYEVVDNSVDEHLAGFCSLVSVRLLPDSVIEVQDNGRGIPVGIHPEAKISSLEVVMTKLHAGGKFEKGAYKISGGLHGVGVSVVNALSEWLEAEVYRNGKVHFQRYQKGIPDAPVKQRKGPPSFDKGSIVRFRADDSIFTTLEYNSKELYNRLEQTAFLHKGLRLILSDERRKGEEQKHEFCYQGGIVEMAAKLTQKKTLLHKKIIYLEGTKGDLLGEFAIAYTSSQSENIQCFTNGIINSLGGTHLEGFRAALTRTMNEFLKKDEVMRKKLASQTTLSGEDVREGITAVVSVKIPEPQFNSQTKEKLVNAEVKGLIQQLVGQKLALYLEENPQITKTILEKCILSNRARDAARKAREFITKRKGVLEGSGLPGKLADCAEKDPRSKRAFYC